MEKEKIQELSFKNKLGKVTVNFLPNSLFLKERLVVSSIPRDIDKKPCKYKKLKNGKYALYFQFVIPNGFIYDAFRINDEDIKEKLLAWFENMVADVAGERTKKK